MACLIASFSSAVRLWGGFAIASATKVSHCSLASVPALFHSCPFGVVRQSLHAPAPQRSSMIVIQGLADDTCERGQDWGGSLGVFCRLPWRLTVHGAANVRCRICRGGERASCRRRSRDPGPSGDPRRHQRSNQVRSAVITITGLSIADCLRVVAIGHEAPWLHLGHCVLTSCCSCRTASCASATIKRGGS